MVLEPKHKNFKGPLQIKGIVKQLFNIRRHMSMPRAFEWYYFTVILIWRHSPFKNFEDHKKFKNNFNIF